MDFSPSVCHLEVTASLDNSKVQRDGWGSCLRERKNHKETSKITWATLCLLTLPMAQGLKPSPRCAPAQVWLTLGIKGSYSSSLGEVWVNFCPKAKPKLKRTQIKCNRTTTKPPQVISKEQKSTNPCLIGWRKGPWMLTEGTLTICLFYYMQLTCVLGSMKKSHVLYDDSSGSKKNGFFSFLLVNIFPNTFLPDCKIRAISYHKLCFTKERKKRRKI